jgi:hypothetical protein
MIRRWQYCTDTYDASAGYLRESKTYAGIHTLVEGSHAGRCEVDMTLTTHPGKPACDNVSHDVVDRSKSFSRLRPRHSRA